MGCAQESRCGRWRGVSFCRVCHPRCYWRRCTQRLYNAPAIASRMDAGSAAGMTAQTRRLCHRAPLHCCPDPHGVIRLCANRAAVRQSVQARLRSPCTNCPGQARHDGAERTREEQKAGHPLVRIPLHGCMFFPLLSFPPPSGNPSSAALCVRVRGHCRGLLPLETLCTTSLQCLAIASLLDSLTRQSGCGSAIRASPPTMSFRPPSRNPG